MPWDRYSNSTLIVQRCATVSEVAKNLQVASTKSKVAVRMPKTSQKAQKCETHKSCLS